LGSNSREAGRIITAWHSRGSAADPAVPYCLRITSINPVEVDLPFERFISAECRALPDIDVDFEGLARIFESSGYEYSEGSRLAIFCGGLL